jgi:DNA replicative helicase MCM subunit Mcm2 (Cdc46/Mcm family)
MVIVCEQCGRKGTVDEQSYSGKKLKLKCPHCSGDFIYHVPGNGNGSGPVLLVQTAGEVSVDPDLIQEDTETVILEAKRIARLIISEIKLYNQEKIERAETKREILELLKSDLLRGKEHYNSRIAARLPMGPDYFMETVREILLAGKD